MSLRTIKIQEALMGQKGSFLRMGGLWLQSAGFHAGAHVRVESEQAGVLVLRVCSPVEVSAKDEEFCRVAGVLDEAVRKADERAPRLGLEGRAA